MPSIHMSAIHMSAIQKLTTVASIAGLVALTACATPEERAAEREADAAEMALRKGEKVDRICFTTGINGFSGNTRNSVILTKNLDEKYLVETAACSNLEFAVSLDIQDRTGCLTRGDYLIAYDTAFPDSVDVADSSRFGRCAITAIHEWKTDEDLEEERMSAM